MKSFNCVGEMDQFGLQCLTGEACGLGMRLLFDVTEPGRKLLEKFFGVNQLILPQDWNGGEAVGSIMLAADQCTPIAIMGMLEQGCIEVWQQFENNERTGFLFGLENEEELKLAGENMTCWPNVTYRHWKYHGTAGSRNVHAMSGRIN